MDSVVTTVNKSVVTSATEGDVSWQTTQASLTQEEEDAIISLIVIAIGIVATIVLLFSMGVFIDCRHQKTGVTKKKRMRLKMPPLSRRRERNDDGKSFASDMCPNGDSDLGSIPATGDAMV